MKEVYTYLIGTRYQIDVHMFDRNNIYQIDIHILDRNNISNMCIPLSCVVPVKCMLVCLRVDTLNVSHPYTLLAP